MKTITEVIVALAGVAIIVTAGVYFANHVDCGKIPFLGSACIISK